MAVDAVGLVAVQPAEQRTLVENRHRRLGLAVQGHDRVAELLRPDAAYVGDDVQRRAQHRAVERRIGDFAGRTSRRRSENRGGDHAPFQHKIRTFVVQKYDFLLELPVISARK